MTTTERALEASGSDADGGPVLLGVWTEEELDAVHPGGSILGVEDAAAYPSAAAPYVRAALIRSLTVRGDLIAQGMVEFPAPTLLADGAEDAGDEDREDDDPEDVTDQALAYDWGDLAEEQESLVVSPDSPLALVVLARSQAERAVVIEVRTPGYTSAIGYLGGPEGPWLEEAKLPGAVRRFALHRLEGLLGGLVEELGLGPVDGAEPEPGGPPVWAVLHRDEAGRLEGPGAEEVNDTVDHALHLLTVESVRLDDESDLAPRIVVAHAAERPAYVLLGPPGPGRVLAARATGMDHAAWLRAAFVSGLLIEVLAPTAV